MKIFFFQGFREINYFDIERNKLNYLNKNYDLTIFETKNLVNKKNIKIELKNNNLIKDYKIIRISKFKELIFQLYQIPRQSIIIYEGMDVEFVSVFTYLYLKIKKCFFIRLGFSIGLYHFDKSKITYNSHNNKNILIRKIFYFFKNNLKNILRKLFLIKADFFIYSGKSNLIFYKHNINKKTKLVSTYSYEYQNCKLVKNKIINDSYAVYLDQGIGYHKETLGLTRKEIIDFYFNLNNFFDFIEKTLKIKIVISAHPLSKNDNFNNRQVFSFDTPNLVKYSNFAIAICSGSIVYPLLLNKKILFIEANILEKLPIIKKNNLGVKNLLKVKYINFNDDITPEIIKTEKINYNLRKNFIQSFALDINNFNKRPYDLVINLCSNRIKKK